MTPPDREGRAAEWLHAIALELELLGEAIARLGAELCEDELVLARHPVRLQSFDLSAQIAHGLAAMLRADDHRAALAACPNRALAEQIERRVADRTAAG